MIEPITTLDLAKHRLAEDIERARTEALASSVRRRGRRATRFAVRVRVAAWLHGLADRIQPMSSRIQQPTV